MGLEQLQPHCVPNMDTSLCQVLEEAHYTCEKYPSKHVAL